MQIHFLVSSIKELVGKFLKVLAGELVVVVLCFEHYPEGVQLMELSESFDIFQVTVILYGSLVDVFGVFRYPVASLLEVFREGIVRSEHAQEVVLAVLFFVSVVLAVCYADFIGHPFYLIFSGPVHHFFFHFRFLPREKLLSLEISHLPLSVIIIHDISCKVKGFFAKIKGRDKDYPVLIGLLPVFNFKSKRPFRQLCFLVPAPLEEESYGLIALTDKPVL